MKTIIAGSRSITSYALVRDAIEACPWREEITEVVSGCARGVDRLGEIWASQNDIPKKIFPPDWKRYGKSAGICRNRQMADYADALILIWDGSSAGSRHMLSCFKGREHRTHIKNVFDESELQENSVVKKYLTT